MLLNIALAECRSSSVTTHTSDQRQTGNRRPYLLLMSSASAAATLQRHIQPQLPNRRDNCAEPAKLDIKTVAGKSYRPTRYYL